MFSGTVFPKKMSYLPTEVAVAIATVIDEAFDRWAETQDRPTLDRFELSMARGRLKPRTLSRRMSRDLEALREWRSTRVFPKSTQARKAWEYVKALRPLDAAAADQIETYLRGEYFADVWARTVRRGSPASWMAEANPWELSAMLGDSLYTGEVRAEALLIDKPVPHLWQPPGVQDKDWRTLEWDSTRELPIPSRGLPRLDRELDAHGQLCRFVVWCEKHDIPERVAWGAIRRILGPLTARARTQALAPGWEDLSTVARGDFLRLGIKRERLILGGEQGDLFNEVAARRRYESTFVEKTIPLTKDLEALIERDESDFQAALDSGEIELEGTDPWKSD